MKFKLIVIMVEDLRTKSVVEAAREAGATGLTVLNQARGEGVVPQRTFLGLSMESQVDVLLLLAEEHRSRKILERVAAAGEFDEASGTGIAFQVDVEDAIGLKHQIKVLKASQDEPGDA